MDPFDLLTTVQWGKKHVNAVKNHVFSGKNRLNAAKTLEI